MRLEAKLLSITTTNLLIYSTIARPVMCRQFASSSAGTSGAINSQITQPMPEKTMAGVCLKLDQEHLTMGTIDLDLRNHHPRRIAIHLIRLPRKDQGKSPEFDQKEVKRALNKCGS